MKTILSFLYCILICSLTAKAQPLLNANDSLAYSLGVLVGKNLKVQGFGNLPMEILYRGMMNSLKDEALSIPSTECEQYVRVGSEKLKMKQYESNKVTGEQFLATNKTRTGVISLDSGVQYEILKAGDGPKPGATDTVLVHYHGTLTDGRIFDSSVDRGKPITYPVNKFITGWKEVLQLMPVGSKWKVYVPYQLAYGDRSSGQNILPYSALIFEMELLGIE